MYYCKIWLTNALGAVSTTVKIVQSVVSLPQTAVLDGRSGIDKATLIARIFHVALDLCGPCMEELAHYYRNSLDVLTSDLFNPFSAE